MNTRAYGQAMFALLGLGTADVVVLNVWAVPMSAPSTFSTANPASAPTPGTTPASTDHTTALNAIRSADPVVAPSPGTILQPPPLSPAVPTTRPVSPAAAISPSRPERATLHKSNIHFHRGTWWVGPTGRRTLRSSLGHLTPASRIELEGHADESGSTEINQRISARSAAVVAGLLVRAGIDPARIEQRAFGEARATGTRFDRRVELIIRGGP